MRLLLTGVIAFITSCNSKNDDLTDSVYKAGSVETSVTVEHADSTHDVLITSHRVWANFNEYKTIVYRDTVPALGIENTTAENGDGDTKHISVKKDYEIYITVK